MLKIENVKKSFGLKNVLNGINLTLNKGEVYGLIGANGAGKTTLLNIVARVLNADVGKIFVDEKEIKIANDLKGLIGYIIDIPALYDFLTPYEYLEFISSPLNLSKEKLKEKSDIVLKDVGLSDCGNKRIKTFSRGMKQRMGIAAGLISEPEIILMDEPMSALDPQGRYEVMQIIEKLKQDGKTIIFSTHILGDVEKVCDRVGILVNGKIQVEGNIQDILNKYSENVFKVYVNESDFEKVIDTAKKCEYFVSATPKANFVEIEFLNGGKKKMFKNLSGINADINGIVLKEQTIEQIFMNLSKEN